MDLVKVAAEMFMKKVGGSGANLDSGTVQSALAGLLGDGSNIDLGSIVSKFGSQGLTSLVGSWLGDGSNQAVSGNQILGMFGDNAIGDFASKLNLSSESASEGLAGMIPDLLDQNSKGGSLLDAVGGGAGLLGMAKKFF